MKIVVKENSCLDDNIIGKMESKMEDKICWKYVRCNMAHNNIYCWHKYAHIFSWWLLLRKWADYLSVSNEVFYFFLSKALHNWIYFIYVICPWFFDFKICEVPCFFLGSHYM